MRRTHACSTTAIGSCGAAARRWRPAHHAARPADGAAAGRSAAGARADRGGAARVPDGMPGDHRLSEHPGPARATRRPARGCGRAPRVVRRSALRFRDGAESLARARRAIGRGLAGSAPLVPRELPVLPAHAGMAGPARATDRDRPLGTRRTAVGSGVAFGPASGVARQAFSAASACSTRIAPISARGTRVSSSRPARRSRVAVRTGSWPRAWSRRIACTRAWWRRCSRRGSRRRRRTSSSAATATRNGPSNAAWCSPAKPSRCTGACCTPDAWSTSPGSIPRPRVGSSSRRRWCATAVDRAARFRERNAATDRRDREPRSPAAPARPAGRRGGDRASSTWSASRAQVTRPARVRALVAGAGKPGARICSTCRAIGCWHGRSLAFAPADFPDRLDVAGNSLELRYVFDPLAEDDGVTLVLPLPLLPVLRARRLEWLVPGCCATR